MSSFEWFIIIGVIVAPIAALLLVLPKIKKKQKTFETTSYVPETKEEPKEVVAQDTKPKEEVKKENIEFKSPFQNREFENYRDFLMNRQDAPKRPQRLDLMNGFNQTPEDFYLSRRRHRKQDVQNQDIHSLSDEMKALMILGIFDKKY